MKKFTTGALAASAAGALLLGGASTLAFWSDSATVDAGSISSGSIDLTDVTCAGWNHREVTGAVTTIVPGDTIRNICTGTLTLVGDHIGATVELDPASVTDVTGELKDNVTVSATMIAPAATVSAADVYTVTINVDVDFKPGTDSVESQAATATLDQLQLIATQTHP